MADPVQGDVAVESGETESTSTNINITMDVESYVYDGIPTELTKTQNSNLSLIIRVFMNTLEMMRQRGYETTYYYLPSTTSGTNLHAMDGAALLNFWNNSEMSLDDKVNEIHATLCTLRNRAGLSLFEDIISGIFRRVVTPDNGAPYYEYAFVFFAKIDGKAKTAKHKERYGSVINRLNETPELMIGPVIYISDMDIYGSSREDFYSMHLDITTFLFDELTYIVTNHYLVPIHTPLTNAESSDFLLRNGIRSFQLPIIRSDDAVVKFLGIKPGTVVRVTRISLEDYTVKVSIAHRRVIR
jgi:DNA-directed RNA polymerase subunit H (RpoH/RPB5)